MGNRKLLRKGVLMIRISEMFKTIQGEGTYTGRPVVFIRTSGCNLRCGWCDTPFASWNPEGDKMELFDVVDETLRMLGRSNEVVISGGEPMMVKEIGILVEMLKNAGCHITMETAGTIFKDIDVDLWSISPKMRNSYPDKEKFPEEYEIHHKNLTKCGLVQNLVKFIKSDVPYQLKFVISNEQDIIDLQMLIKCVDDLLSLTIRKKYIFLMPEGKTSEELERSKMLCIEHCMQKDYTYTGRLHIELWGNARGK